MLPLALLLTSCSGTGDSSPSQDPDNQLTVFAASSLTRAFTTIGQEFEQANPGTRLRFSFGGSADLVAQLEQGAPADVFASADEANMSKAVTGGLVAGEAHEFASNSMAIAVPPGNPAGIGSFADLGDPNVKVVVCAPQVPCGAATVTVEERTGTSLTPVSEEQAVSDVLGKVASGEADAGIVYVTDIKNANGAVSGIAIPRPDNAVNSYPIAVLSSTGEPTLAQEFQTWVLGPRGRRVLHAAGFSGP